MDVYGSNPTLIVLESIALWNGIICFCLSLFLNLFLILSIFRYSPPHMGIYYKIVQGILSLCSIILVFLVVMSRPTMHVHSGIFFFSAQPPFIISQLSLTILLFTFIFFFVQNKGILSTLMIYRIIHMKFGHNHHLHPLIIISLPTISLILSLPITALLIFVLIPSDEKNKLRFDGTTMEEAINRHLSSHSTFILSTISEGERRNWWFICGMVLLVLLLLSSSIIINVGAKKITSHATHARDSLQRQLARSLYTQSLVPSILVQIPIGIGVVGALFNQDMDFFFHLLPIVSAWYTVVDPLIIFHNVRSYRHAIFRVLRLSCWKDGISPIGTGHLEGKSSKGHITLPTGGNRVIPFRRSSSLEPHTPSIRSKDTRRA
ncbi:hypothetical protein PRIPAC_77876 [Pristionchus pacificus]|uniref:G protein-coupled receptor n=1 Tax=Pristionchus pacificus TaxID=54126 RepID=A0A2A6BE06_PRIPA|nr:hypothetical protein PRIPAC_77876 [Pristionchus pacificus]|eukprot:PDM64117.1 G protein-coupled receptor [Pristionchus pacificus]